MNVFEKIDLIVQENDGIITTGQIIESEISKPMLYKYLKEKGFKQISHGIYASENAWVDSMYILHLRSPNSVLSHDTALYLHGLTDREPFNYSLTVKRGYNTARLKADGIDVYTVKEDLVALGKTALKTPFGRSVPVYDMERTVCDLIRYRNNIEIQVLQNALKSYVKRKDKDLRKLMIYAKAFRVEGVVRQYMEVLL